MKKINISLPHLPEIERVKVYLEDIWACKQVTNIGKYHKEFEEKLNNHLNVDNTSLFTNGTIALITGLHALGIKGEVITTPYSFVGTTHSLSWNNIKPVFCDICEDGFNIDPDKIEKLITKQTTAILAVHVYGYPCDNERIQKIAQKFNLKLIYDAAHSFGVEKHSNSILNWGDLSILSFHATKVFHTIEGGAVVTKNRGLKKRIDFLKNFGFKNEVTVTGIGINGKMNELISALGILQLEDIEMQINIRKEHTYFYRNLLADIEGISYLKDIVDVKHNYSYFPILIDEKHFGKSRDEIYFTLKKHNIFCRRYFYPLISQFPPYKKLKSAHPQNLPISTRKSLQVICLPLFSDLTKDDIEAIVKIIKSKK